MSDAQYLLKKFDLFKEEVSSLGTAVVHWQTKATDFLRAKAFSKTVFIAAFEYALFLLHHDAAANFL